RLGFWGRTQGRGGSLADSPVLVLQRRVLFGNAVRNGEGLRSPLPERDSAAPHCRRSAGNESGMIKRRADRALTAVSGRCSWPLRERISLKLTQAFSDGQQESRHEDCP